MVNGLGSDLENVVVVPFCHSEADITLKSGQEVEKNNDVHQKREIFMSNFLDLGKDVNERDVLKFEQLPFNHPLFIMYSSGTTGKPKCIVSK